MKLQLNHHPDSLLIHSCTLGSKKTSAATDPKTGAATDPPSDEQRYRIRIADTWYRQSLILTPQSVELWDVKEVSDLQLEHFHQLAELGAEVIILGTGKHTVFPQPALTRPLMRQRIGLEVMDTAAACRTYNILVVDGRSAITALIV